MHEVLADLFRHMEWADAAVWNAVRSHEGARSDAKVRALVVHIHLVQRAFLSIWTHAAIETPEPQSFATVEAVREWGRSYYAAAHGFVANAERLDETVVLPWSAQLSERFGEVHDTTLGETMMQVTAHSTYHRGQLNARLREIGAEPPLVDYIAWLWRGRPQPEWTT